jgi:hypothetical protein
VATLAALRAPARGSVRAFARAVLAAALVAGAARPLAAQLQPAPAAPQLPYLQTISVNPLAIPFGVFSAEYEVALPVPGLTTAVGGTYTANSPLFERNDRWIEGRVMYYPNEVALRGLSLGLSLGARRVERKDNEAARGVKPNDGAATLGIMAGYNYLLGRQERLILGGGIGAVRVLRTVRNDSPLTQVYPDGRVLIGFAF